MANVDGIAFQMGNDAPPPPNPEQNSVIAGAGSAIATGVGGAMGASMGNKMFGKSAKEQGKDQRAYMDEAYGDLNQWEQAGAGQQGTGTANEGMKSQERIAGKNNMTAEKVNSQTLKQQKPVVDAQAQQIKAQTHQINEQTKQMKFGKLPSQISNYGADASDIKDGVLNGVKGAWNSSKDWLKKNVMSKENPTPKPKKRMNIKVTGNEHLTPHEKRVQEWNKKNNKN